MSYCVNCGVELERSQAQCPLCGTDVHNPRAPFDNSARRPYSNRVARIQKRIERRFAAIVATVAVLLACAVCVMADLVYGETAAISWSAYPVGALLLLWVFVFFPLCFPGIHPAAYVLLDVCVLLLFLYVINRMDPTADWFAALAVPQVLFYGLLGLGDVWACRSKKIRGLMRPACIVASAGLGMMALEALLDLFNDMAVRLDWSWFVIIPCLGVAVMLIIIERKKALKDEILKRLRV